jgi:hypothetical protein
MSNHFSKEIKDRLLKSVPGELRLDEIVDKYVSTKGACSLYVDKIKDVFTVIYLDESGGKERYQCNFRLMLKSDGCVQAAEYKARTIGRDPDVHLMGLRGVLFSLMVRETRIIIA